jgi:hypothetical protein
VESTPETDAAALRLSVFIEGVIGFLTARPK